MDLFEAIRRRYSHKTAFDPSTPVPEQHLTMIAEAGMAAPSGMNRQTPEFIIVNDRALLKRIGEITQNVPLQTAPAVIAIVSDTSELTPGMVFYLEDYAAATENILLAATALGYCVGWLDALLRPSDVNEQVSALLDVPADRKLLVLIPVGKPGADGPRRRKKPFEQRVCWNHYTIPR